MNEAPPGCEQEIARLNERVRKLAEEKSWSQLMLNLMGRLSAVPGLDNTVNNLLTSSVELIGGTNVVLYYFLDERIHYADVWGAREILPAIDDPLVRQAIETRRFAEVGSDFSDTKMLTPAFSQAWTWVSPLLVADTLIGVFKIEGMHIGALQLVRILPSFFNYAALILHNEMQSHSRLEQTYQQLRQTNAALRAEIVERQKAEEALRQAKDQAEAANRAKSMFLANMSHELRTPLNAILGFSQLMARDPAIPPAQRANLDIINRSGQHLLTLINDVLDMSKIEAGRVAVVPAPFDLHELVRDVTDMMRMRAQHKGIELAVDQSSQFPRLIETDAPKLRQVLINLLGNAVKFTEHGRVLVRLRAEPGAAPDQLTLFCEIEDTGPGIAAQDQEAIFQPFIQVGAQGWQQGTGLGLTITRQFVELMGGKIGVQSQPGKGSRFFFSLPAKRVQTSQAAASARLAEQSAKLAAGQPAYRILIAEDQMENRLLLKTLLEKAGFTVDEAADGQQAVEAFRRCRPDLIFMDHRMPVMDGEEATRCIRALPHGQDSKIVALTASVFQDKRARLLAAGMDDFISKPFHFEEIFDCLRRLLGAEFQSAGAEQTAPAETFISVVPVQLRALPPALHEALCQAALSLDIDKTEQLAAEIAQIDESLAAWLRHYLDEMDFETIWRSLEESA